MKSTFATLIALFFLVATNCAFAVVPSDLLYCSGEAGTSRAMFMWIHKGSKVLHVESAVGLQVKGNLVDQIRQCRNLPKTTRITVTEQYQGSLTAPVILLSNDAVDLGK